jgi:hypothetical protein
MATHWSDAGAEAALERGNQKLRNEPRAVSARYDAKSGRIIVELTSGATFAFPPALGVAVTVAITPKLMTCSF